MSEDIRMSDVFDLPVEVEMGDEDHLVNIVHVWEDDPDVADLILESMTSEGSANAIAHAINEHDKLAVRVKELEEGLKTIISLAYDGDSVANQIELLAEELLK